MRLILSSQSPRRRELLASCGFHFDVIAPRVDEYRIRGEAPGRMVARLAALKAKTVMSGLEAKIDCVVISADTTVVAPGGKKILEKPASILDAARMIRLLQGRVHHVLTGYCILARRAGKLTQVKRTVRTAVEFRKLTAAEIKTYAESGEGLDKAGAYGAQALGMILIRSVRGSYTNVVGLPIAELLEDLAPWIKALPRT
jgi:septum formation protein